MSLLLAGLLIKTLWVIIGLILIILAVKYHPIIFKDLADVSKEVQDGNYSVAIIVAAFIIGICIFLGLLL